MKWLLRGVLTLVTLVLLAALVLVLIPTERIARLAADRISAATGRAVTIAGPVHATLWPRLGVRAEGVVVANADWSEEGPMLSAASMEVGVAPASLVGGAIRVDTLEVTDARLLLERRADGVGNWQMGGPGQGDGAAASDGGGSGGPGREVSIDRAVLSNAEVTWIDHAAGRQIRARAVDLETRLDGLDAPVDVAGSAMLGDVAVRIEASAGALRPLQDGSLVPVALSVTAGDTRVAADGRADLDPPSFEGRVEAHSTDRFALLAALGFAAPDLPEGLGARSVDLTASATLAPAGTVHLRDMVAVLDGNRITGALDLDPTGARPRIAATLAAEALDLTAVAGAPGGGGTSGGASTGWSTAPINVSGLFLADAEVTLATGRIALGAASVDELRARATVEDGRAVVTLQPLLAYGATVTGEVVANGRGGLSASADLDLSGLQMQPVLTAFAGMDRLVGVADASVDLLGAGDSVAALMASLDGTAGLRVGQGELLGLDIPGMVRSLDLGYRGEGQRTIFDGLSISTTIADGVARSDDLALTAPYLTAAGAGTADLGARTLNYRLLPTVRAQQDGDGLTVPISIEGPWADPRIRPDLEYLARQRLDVERDKLEAQVRAEAEEARARVAAQAREKLAAELDVDAATLDSREAVEEAIVDRVQDKLLDLLRNR